MKKYIKPIFLIIVFSYLGLYFFYSSSYQESLIRKEKELMEEMVLKYEEDLANGKDVSKEDYIIKQPDYSNIYTNTTLKLSSKITSFIDGAIKFLFRKLSEMVNE